MQCKCTLCPLMHWKKHCNFMICTKMHCIALLMHWAEAHWVVYTCLGLSSVKLYYTGSSRLLLHFAGKSLKIKYSSNQPISVAFFSLHYKLSSQCSAKENTQTHTNTQTRGEKSRTSRSGPHKHKKHTHYYTKYTNTQKHTHTDKWIEEKVWPT